jgi:hypothetical protein
MRNRRRLADLLRQRRRQLLLPSVQLLQRRHRARSGHAFHHSLRIIDVYVFRQRNICQSAGVST